MIRYYKATLLKLFSDLKQIEADPWSNKTQIKDIQLKALKKIIYIEKRILNLKQEIKNNKKILATNNKINKADAQIIKHLSQNIKTKITEYRNLIHIFRSIIDGIVFLFISPWDAKQFILKEKAGFISGKSGIKNEILAFKQIFDTNNIAILNDLTTCLRHTDITEISLDKPYSLIEIKSSETHSPRSYRQLKNANEVINYLNTGEKEISGYYEKLTRKRHHNKSPTYHTDILNYQISESYSTGTSFKKIEEGLYYEVSHNASVELLAKKIEEYSLNPFLYVLNFQKYSTFAYVPFTLSIYEPQHIYDFYAGNFIITVMIDKKAIKKAFEEKGYTANFPEKEIEKLIVKRKKDQSIYVTVGEHFFNRIAFEFLSLEWVINESLQRISKPPK